MIESIPGLSRGLVEPRVESRFLRAEVPLLAGECTTKVGDEARQ